jgi:hypothetical protein
VTQIIINSQDAVPSYTSNFFSALIILTTLSFCYIALDAVLNENEFQLFGFLVMTLAMTARITYQLVRVQISGRLRYMILVPAIVVYMCQIGFFIIIIPVYRSFGWKLYYKVGTSPELGTSYKWYQFYLTLVKIDLETCTSLVLMAIWLLNWQTIVSYVGFGVGVLFTFVIAPFGVYLGCRKEIKIIQWLAIILNSGFPIFIIYNIVAIWVFPNQINLMVPIGEINDIRIILTIMSVFAVLMRVNVLIFGILMTFQQGKGLVDVFNKDWFMIPSFVQSWFERVEVEEVLL